ncbi:MAG: hypothetical protein AAF250_00645 [Pseudomonadota bacterium]
MDFVYVFHGEGARFAAAVYLTVEDARVDIADKRLSGLLTAYPVGQTVFDHVLEAGLFAGKEGAEPRYIQRFSSAHLEHYHFKDGALV